HDASIAVQVDEGAAAVGGEARGGDVGVAALVDAGGFLAQAQVAVVVVGGAPLGVGAGGGSADEEGIEVEVAGARVAALHVRVGHRGRGTQLVSELPSGIAPEDAVGDGRTAGGVPDPAGEARACRVARDRAVGDGRVTAEFVVDSAA